MEPEKALNSAISWLGNELSASEDELTIEHLTEMLEGLNQLRFELTGRIDPSAETKFKEEFFRED